MRAEKQKRQLEAGGTTFGRNVNQVRVYMKITFLQAGKEEI
jgi:hypothetical protein